MPSLHSILVLSKQSHNLSPPGMLLLLSPFSVQTGGFSLMLLLCYHCGRSEESLAPRKMRSVPSKVEHPEEGNTGAVRGCDAQVNHSGTPYIKVWVWVRSAGLRAVPWVVAAKLWRLSLHKPSQYPGSWTHCCSIIYSSLPYGVSPCCFGQGGVSCGDQMPWLPPWHAQIRSQTHWDAIHTGLGCSGVPQTFSHWCWNKGNCARRWGVETAPQPHARGTPKESLCIENFTHVERLGGTGTFFSLPLCKARVVWKYSDPHQTSSHGQRKQANLEL